MNQNAHLQKIGGDRESSLQKLLLLKKIPGLCSTVMFSRHTVKLNHSESSSKNALDDDDDEVG